MAHFEIEIKTLLGEKANADALKSKMCELDPECACTSTNNQLNHYFTGGDLGELYAKTEHLFTGEQHAKFQKMAEKGTDFSVRTRKRDEEVLLVVKASIDEGTSENTVSRLEFEEPACAVDAAGRPVAITLDELDTLVQEAGFEYQAKWSREREEYSYKGITVCLDKNAGYGFLAEFEKLTDDEAAVPDVRENLIALMKELEVEELAQDRLGRMFEHYNENWPEYYGTDKTFNIE